MDLFFVQKMTTATIAGVEPSTEMVSQDAVRNAEAIERLPSDNPSGETLAINSMQLLPNYAA
ncbi:hypothetical protein E2553_27080 [Paraburkholderia dipogonis]|uniref:Uncharacterized protein n=1 Tax=Paraburkholderia dipogonis TaxID=1211383 RepID=A0A4Y8MSF6_9BURK|nr:hypothetical protein [Paraburkholderia dipogonis]TFE40427.1 hypothetical protein E2553_27080 [Paraburkholderia dipogonis]